MGTIVHRKRKVSRADGSVAYCPFDVRRWILPPDDELMGKAWEQLARQRKRYLQACHKRHRSDRKAKVVWDFVVEQIPFVADAKNDDHWQFPPETLMLSHGDCEDKSFLIASLLLAAGIPASRVRVMLGLLISPQRKEGHAWPMYCNSHGVWCILEPNIPHLPIGVSRDRSARTKFAKRRASLDRTAFVTGDRMASDAAFEKYVPVVCFNHTGVWTVERTDRGRAEGTPEHEPNWTKNPTFDQILQWAAMQLAAT